MAVMMLIVLTLNVTYGWRGMKEYTNEFTGSKTGVPTVEPPEPPEPPDRFIEVTVSKVWQGDTKHPDSVTVQLYRGGVAYGRPITLSAANSWTHKWSKLPYGSVWTADETEVPKGYTKTVTGDAESGFIITNTLQSTADKPENPDGPDEPKDPGTDIGDSGVPGGGADPEDTGDLPYTSDDADATPWLITLALSTIALRYLLFFKRTREKT